MGTSGTVHWNTEEPEKGSSVLWEMIIGCARIYAPLVFQEEGFDKLVNLSFP